MRENVEVWRHSAKDTRVLQLSFSSPRKMVVLLFLPTHLDVPVMWNASRVKYLPLDAVRESKEAADDGDSSLRALCLLHTHGKSWYTQVNNGGSAKANVSSGEATFY